MRLSLEMGILSNQREVSGVSTCARTTGNFGRPASMALLKCVGMLMAASAAEVQGDIGDSNALLLDLTSRGVLAHAEVKVMPAPGDDKVNIRGLAATQKLVKGDVALSVPRALTLYQETLNSRVQKMCRHVGRKHCTPDIELMIGLAVEAQHPRPEFATYIASLPKKVSNFWSFGKAQKRFADAWFGGVFSDAILKSFNEAVRLSKEFGIEVTEAEITWSYSLVLSRSFKVDGVIMFIPGMDLINAAGFDESKQAVIFQAHEPQCDAATCWVDVIRPIAKGEQIVMSYGGQSNFHLLMQYGFIYPSNPYGPPIALVDDLRSMGSKAWLEHFGCARQKNSVSVFGGPGTGVAGAVFANDLHCLFLSAAFKSQDAAEAGLESGAASCIQGDKQKCPRDVWRKVSASVHRSAAAACRTQAALWNEQQARDALDEISFFKDQISLQLATAAAQDVKMTNACAEHHEKIAAGLEREEF